MSEQTIEAFLGLYPEKKREQNSIVKVLSVHEIYI